MIPGGEARVRVGVAFDLHPLVAGRPLILGGVRIPFERGLDGDSDADVLTHAMLDALLGAAGEGDIGTHFGVGRSEMRGISSLVLLERVVTLLAAKGYQPNNVDATVIAEAPRIGPHIPAMRKALAAVLRIDEDRVNIKGTTAKGLGWLGAGQGIAVMAVASVLSLPTGRPGVSSHRTRRPRHGR
ncbi:MAG TPA: 2-C-methyl-D-erythritol 2,4-cyclodiphosphate synthase [Candidatus Methylomirabilis sp.]|nr:2-C-methyl-D-erythritol 2,4-cyclodiphosphate synthase [Candidatus Methylomirabilis sp.]